MTKTLYSMLVQCTIAPGKVYSSATAFCRVHKYANDSGLSIDSSRNHVWLLQGDLMAATRRSDAVQSYKHLTEGFKESNPTQTKICLHAV